MWKINRAEWKTISLAKICFFANYGNSAVFAKNFGNLSDHSGCPQVAHPQPLEMQNCRQQDRPVFSGLLYLSYFKYNQLNSISCRGRIPPSSTLGSQKRARKYPRPFARQSFPSPYVWISFLFRSLPGWSCSCLCPLWLLCDSLCRCPLGG